MAKSSAKKTALPTPPENEVRASARQEEFLASPAREILFGGSAGGGKMLRLSEPIPTPTGWTTIGELHRGDLVFSERGAPVRVLQTHPIDLTPTSFRLTFDDGTTIEACEDHLWLTFDAKELGALTRRDPAWRAARRARRPKRVSGKKSVRFSEAIAARNAALAAPKKDPPRGTVRSTRQIFETLRTARGRTNHAVPVASALNLPPADLPLDPYVLGLWLGDGSTSAAGFTTADPEMLSAFTRIGMSIGKSQTRGGRSRTYGILGLHRPLRLMGLLGHKRVPAEYLRASREQRLSLLKGLMDTDGTVTDGGAAEFTTTSPELAVGTHELILSLGWKARLVEGRATLRGKDCGPKWDIKWTPSEYVFDLERKRSKQRLASRRTTRFRYIVGCEPCAPSPMRCITVDNPTGLFLVGRSMVPTHNTQALIYQPLARVSLPNYHALALRRTFPELEASFIERSKALYPRLGGTYNEQRKSWLWRSRARVSFGYVDGIDDTARYQSSEFQDILWDELTTHKKGDAYEFLFSRLRSPFGYAGYVRAASNPGGKGHRWVFNRFAPWLWEPGVAEYPGALTDNGEIPRPRPGQTLWIRRDSNGIEWITHRRWHDPRCPRCQPREPCILHEPVSRAFIPSRVTDNKYLAGGEYERTLHNLPPIERARLLNGDWNIMPAAGMYFRREWFPRLDAAPSDVIARVRYWDRAATEGGGDWTVGVRMSVRPGPFYVVEHVARAQLGPGGVEKLIRTTAESDPPGTICALEQDPGQAGKVEIFNYAKLLSGFAFVGLPPQGDKLTRARPLSAQAHVGNVGLMPGTWHEAYLTVLEAFEGHGDEVDDDVDASSGAFRVLLAEHERLTKRRSGAKAHVLGMGRAEADGDAPPP